MTNFKKVFILILIITLLPNTGFCFPADNPAALRSPLATSKTVREFIKHNQGKPISDIIQVLGSQEGAFWRHLSHNSASRQIMSDRLKFLLQTKKLPELVKNELQRMKKSGALDVSDQDIENCSIFIFGDYLWHSEKDRPNDIDMLVMVGDAKKPLGTIWNLDSDIPAIAVNIRGTDHLKTNDKGNKNYALLKMGTGVILYGHDLAVDTEISWQDLIKWADGLIQNGFMNDEIAMMDLGDSRKEWKRFFEAYLYLYDLFSENMPEIVDEISGKFLNEDDLRDYVAKFYNGNMDNLPWISMDASKLSEFGTYLLDKTAKLKEKLEKEGPVKIRVRTEKDLIRIKRAHFPDGEAYLRILNSDAVKDNDVTVDCSLNSSQDLVEVVLLMDFLREYGAKSVKLFYRTSTQDSGLDNGLAEFLRLFCDTIVYRDNQQITALDIKPVHTLTAQEKNTSAWVDVVAYQHQRLKRDAVEAAGLLKGAVSRKINIVKNSPNPFNWQIKIDDGLKGKNIALLHSTENSVDIAELWMTLVALRKAGVRSVHLFNAYEGYSRQDKVFNKGEGVSASTMLKAMDGLTDSHFALNVHYLNHTGINRFDGIQIYNVNAFIQISEHLFDFIAGSLKVGDIAEEFKAHPLLLLGPDDGAFQYIKEAKARLTRYIREKYGINVQVHYGYLDKTRISGTEVKMKGEVLSDDGKPITGIPDLKNCWVFIVDDETSSGGTLLTATYVLNKEVGVAWHRILTGVAHGKLAMGLKPFETGLTEDAIKQAIQRNEGIEPQPEYIKDSKKRMPPRLFVCTSSVHLPNDFPQELIVSIGPNIAHFVKRVVGRNVGQQIMDIARSGTGL